MSVVTKVFVVLLTVFSIAFSVMTISFVARMENWKKVAYEWRATGVSAAADAKIVKAQMKLTHEQDLARINQLSAEVAELMNQLGDAKASIDQLTNQGALLQNQLTSLAGTLKGVEQTLAITQSQLVREQDFARQLTKRNNELERRNIDLNDRTKELTVSLAMAHQQNKAYLEQLTSLEQRLEQMSRGPAIQVPDAAATVQAGVPSAIPVGVPAISPIRGAITDVQGNLAEISVGAADGVTRGMTFMVFRPIEGGEPRYVATLEINKVETNRSAGIIVRTNDQERIRVGDPVRDDASMGNKG